MPAKKSAKAVGLSKEERQAMKETMKERARQAQGEDGESAALAAIQAMCAADRAMAERLHKLVKATAPRLSARTWYGMPAYADGDRVILFFKAAQKFKERYATLGFNQHAKLDDGRMWPTSFGLTGLGPAEEKAIAALVAKAVG